MCPKGLRNTPSAIVAATVGNVKRTDQMPFPDETGTPQGGGAKSAALPHARAILSLIHDPIARDLLTEIAVERGYGLFCAPGAREAGQVLSQEPPQLLIIDVDSADGRVLLSMLRAHPGWKQIPILAITGSNNPMMAVSVDAPLFFRPELRGLEEAVTGRFENPVADVLDDEDTSPWLNRHPSA